jgi:hypothetical protein
LFSLIKYIISEVTRGYDEHDWMGIHDAYVHTLYHESTNKAKTKIKF